MSTELLSLIMDFAVLAALGGTIFYVLQLSRNLNNFKSHRAELKSVILELTSNIDRAQDSIEGLKNASNAAAVDLEDVLHDSRQMLDELKMINETGNNLADRLEGLAQRNRRVAQGLEDAPSLEGEEYIDDTPPVREQDNREDPSFFIQDRDFDEGDHTQPQGEHAGDTLSSQAERDLYEALMKNMKTGRS